MRELTSKKGDKINTPYTDSEALDKLQHDESTFARDLVLKSLRYDLSEAQLYWVHKLVLDSENVPTVAKTGKNGIFPKSRQNKDLA